MMFYYYLVTQLAFLDLDIIHVQNLPRSEKFESEKVWKTPICNEHGAYYLHNTWFYLDSTLFDPQAFRNSLQGRSNRHQGVLGHIASGKHYTNDCLSKFSYKTWSSKCPYCDQTDGKFYGINHCDLSQDICLVHFFPIRIEQAVANPMGVDTRCHHSCF